MTGGIDPRSAVTLRIGGTDYGGWTSVAITAGIERLARDFSLAVTDRWPGNERFARRIRPGDACEVRIGGDLVLTGWVDATPVNYDGTQRTLGIAGRSRTADLVDCSSLHVPGQWRGQRIERIAADLAQPYGVAVRAEADTGEAVRDHQIQPGETVAESLDRLLRIRHLLATDTSAGELVIVTVGALRAATALVTGGADGNVLECDAPLDFKDRFSEYICKGQRAGEDAESADAMAGERADSADAAITRRRVLVIKQSGQADGGTCRDRVDYERAVRIGKSLAATYTVAGWRQGDGSLWLPNQVVRVRDGIVGLDRDVVIGEVEYRLDEQGQRTVLRVAPAEAYAVAAWKPAAKKKRAAEGAQAVSGVDEWRDFTKGVQ